MRASTLPLRLTRQTGLGGIGRECWSMYASQGRVRSHGSVRSQGRAPGLDGRASTTAPTRVVVQSWMTILLFVDQISLSTCTNYCGGSFKCQASDAALASSIHLHLRCQSAQGWGKSRMSMTLYWPSRVCGGKWWAEERWSMEAWRVAAEGSWWSTTTRTTLCLSTDACRCCADEHLYRWSGNSACVNCGAGESRMPWELRVEI